MEVIKSESTPEGTIFTVKDGERIFKVNGSANLPAGTYKRWRNRKAAECMRRKREQVRRIDKPLPGPSTPPVFQGQEDFTQDVPEDLSKKNRETQTSQSLIDEARRNEETQTSERLIDEAKRNEETQTSQTLIEDQEAKKSRRDAIELIRCKVCLSRRVDKVIMPCGHFVMCGECLTKVFQTTKRCPMCKTVIKDHMLARLI